jgi:PAS domain S-box-containing protein
VGEGKMERFKKWHYHLSVQLVITLIGLVLLTASAIGIPSLWILRNQLERQAWALVTQGSQMSLAILENKHGDLTDLAILTAQRPTLHLLLQQDTYQDMRPYLEVLQQGANLDLLLICGQENNLVIQVGIPIGQEVCERFSMDGYYGELQAGKNVGWLLSSQDVHAGEENYRVMVGSFLDDEFANQLQEETGLEQILLIRGSYLSSSFPAGSQIWETSQNQQSETLGSRISLIVQDIPHFAYRASFRSGDLDLVVSQPISEVILARQQLTWAFGGGIIAVVFLSSAIGIARSHHISRPLDKLRVSAENLRKGQLSTPIRVETSIFELALLSYALDDARIAIRHSLMELNQEKAWREHLLESVVEGIVTLDKLRRITFFSHGAEAITGWSQEDVLGLPIDDLFPLYEEEVNFSQRLPEPGNQQKVVVRLRNGKPATLAVTGARLAPPEAGKADIAVVLRDVSNEETIRRLLGDFMANISHEFRTPLSALAASIELLLDQLPKLEQGEVEELLNNLHLGVLSLQHLIDNLLEGASIETGRFQVVTKTAGAVEIVEEAARIVQPLVEKHRLILQKKYPDELPDVQADYRRTVQVMVNLLSNAVKWGPTGSKIQVTVIPFDREVEVCVADQGPGISPEILPDLFHRFSHKQGKGRAEQGAGLGLSVVKAIIEAQGGQVGVRNPPEGGAEFWFTLKNAPAINLEGENFQ